jgi:hypothetical protein
MPVPTLLRKLRIGLKKINHLGVPNRPNRGNGPAPGPVVETGLDWASPSREYYLMRWTPNKRDLFQWSIEESLAAWFLQAHDKLN